MAATDMSSILAEHQPRIIAVHRATWGLHRIVYVALCECGYRVEHYFHHVAQYDLVKHRADIAGWNPR